jgi:hypothetical protein
MSDHRDNHRGEAILGECPHCHLPIYQSDPRRNESIPPGSHSLLYHTGCALTVVGLFWEEQVTKDVQRLRGCGYVVELHIVRPVR